MLQFKGSFPFVRLLIGCISKKVRLRQIKTVVIDSGEFTNIRIRFKIMFLSGGLKVHSRSCDF